MFHSMASSAACRARRMCFGPMIYGPIILSLAALLSSCDGGGSSSADVAGAALLRWNTVAIDASGLDHAPTNAIAPHTFGEQLGPCRSSRALAIVHIAMFEAANAVDRRFESYLNLPIASTPILVEIAIAQAARDTLVALFPSQAYAFDAALAADLAAVSDGLAKANAITLGQDAAAAILALRQNDGSNHNEPVIGVDYIPGNGPGIWRQDPVSQVPIALGALWPMVTPFAMTSGSQFRLPPPPALNSPEYATSFNEVLNFGGDGITTPTQSSAAQQFIGVFWAYDGRPSLCAPPRLYNQIAKVIAADMGTTGTELARYLALINTSMADAGIAAWDSKYFYNFWRPVTGIREADPGTGPSGLGDGNSGTTGDVNYMPLGAPASNGTGPNFTPPFPAYPSGHATFGAALFQCIRRFYGTDNISFTFVSDEYDGVTTDNNGNIRPFTPVTFANLSQPEEDNGQSRIYLGIHWSFDKTGGITQGNNVGDFVFDNFFRPLP